MQRLTLLSAIFLCTCLLFSCASNSSASANKDSTSNSTSGNSTDSTYTGKSSLAYTIDGRPFAIKDIMHDGDGKNSMALYINEVKNKPGGMLKIDLTNELSKEVFNFAVANSGTSVVLHYSPSLIEPKNQASYMSSKYKNYYGDSVTVTITGIDASHVSGTFSGKFLSADDKPVPLMITNGSFNVPFTTDKENN